MKRVIYGVHPVEEALRTGRAQAIYVVEGESLGPAIKNVRDLAQQKKVTIEDRSRQELTALVDGATHQGIVAICGEYQYADVDRMFAVAKERNQPLFVLVLDGVQDPGNLGAIVRTAHVLGVHGIILPKDRAAAVNGTVVKTSAGATEHIAIAQVTNISRTLDELKERQVWVVGAAFHDGKMPAEIDWKEPTALVLGAEGKGIRPLVLRGCDLFVKIPMVGQVTSLNVSAAGAILMYEAIRQRS